MWIYSLKSKTNKVSKTWWYRSSGRYHDCSWWHGYQYHWNGSSLPKMHYAKVNAAVKLRSQQYSWNNDYEKPRAAQFEVSDVFNAVIDGIDAANAFQADLQMGKFHRICNQQWLQLIITSNSIERRYGLSSDWLHVILKQLWHQLLKMLQTQWSSNWS